MGNEDTTARRPSATLPPPTPTLRNEYGYYVEPPQFTTPRPPAATPSAAPPRGGDGSAAKSEDTPSKAPPPSPPSHEQSLENLSHADLLQRAARAEALLAHWRHAASDLFTSLALSPDMTDAFYARSLRVLLKDALEALESVDALRHVEFSMPSVASEAPDVQLVRWDGLPFSEWEFEWAPVSWWVSVSADGSRWGLPFNCLANVSRISMKGRLFCSFSPDLTAVRVRFPARPLLRMTVDTSVGWGAVPFPVRQSIEALIRDEVDKFIDERLCNSQGMVIVLRRKMVRALTDSDVLEAKLQAERAHDIRLTSGTIL